MRRFVVNLVMAAISVLAFGGTGQLHAQAIFGQPGYGTSTQPAFSPYLNMLRRGNPAVLNYYGLVRPEINLNRSLQNIQNQVYNNQQANNSSTTAQGPLYSGHPAFYLNTSHYLQFYGGQTAVPGYGGTPRQTSMFSNAAVPPPRGRLR